MSIEIVAFVFGGLLLFVGVVGGGFEVKELEIPKVGRGSPGYLGCSGPAVHLPGNRLGRWKKHKPTRGATLFKQARRDLSTDQLGEGQMGKMLVTSP